jgi:hypothetical protein
MEKYSDYWPGSLVYSVYQQSLQEKGSEFVAGRIGQDLLPKTAGLVESNDSSPSTGSIEAIQGWKADQALWQTGHGDNVILVDGRGRICAEVFSDKGREDHAAYVYEFKGHGVRLGSYVSVQAAKNAAYAEYFNTALDNMKK